MTHFICTDNAFRFIVIVTWRTFWSLPVLRIACYTRISYLDVSKMTFRRGLLFISLESERRKCESAIGLRQFWYSAAKYFANSLGTFAVVDFLLAIFVCWLVVKFPSPRRYEKVTRGTLICPETLEKLPDERVTEWWDSIGLYGLGRELVTKICVQDVGWWNFHPLVFSSGSI